MGDIRALPQASLSEEASYPNDILLHAAPDLDIVLVLVLVLVLVTVDVGVGVTLQALTAVTSPLAPIDTQIFIPKDTVL